MVDKVQKLTVDKVQKAAVEKSPIGREPTVFELMQEVIPPPAFTNDVLITKSLSLPF